MYSSRLGQVGRLLVALLMVFAFGAIVASAAEAVTAPFWTVEESGVKKRLFKNETREITVRSYEGTKTPIVLEAELKGGKIPIECHLASVAKGSFLAGSNVGEPGSSEEVAEFKDCKVGIPLCTVTEPITTNKIRNELVESATEPKTFLVEFKPATGTTFVTLHFTGSGCPSSTEVTGSVVGSLYTDEEVTGATPELVVTTNTKLLPSWLIKFPDEPEHILLWNNGVSELVSPGELKAFENKAKLTGTVLVLLANHANYGAEL
jgi:hypothetical protein